MLIAGRIPLQSVMRQLSEERQVFHSEGDLQHAFGRAIWKLDPRVKVRMEMRQQGVGEAREVLDMLCFTHAGSTAVEFKFYPTAGQGKDLRGEEFNLRGQGADDLLRHGFVHDISRLERFCQASPAGNGLALLISNARALWSESARTGQASQDQEFRLHEGTTLNDIRAWAGRIDHDKTRTLQGNYDLRWDDYAPPVEGLGQFRYLAVEVEPNRLPAG
ncbi:hypothetical protein ACFY5D_14010 [Paeniglutamicibacter sp. NPDC012692]|uniref:hypothetical protein n=1 Tax=Paeniglutamicibacter sp. NPDC012692 TaxID=3364388 RepID=UPI0036B1E838